MVQSGIRRSLCRLRLPARFPRRLGGAAGREGEDQVRDARDQEGEEQAVVVEALDEGRVPEDAGEARGRGGLEEAGEDGTDADDYGGYGPPVPAARVGVAAVVLVEVREVEMPLAQDPVVDDHPGPDGPEQAPVAHQPREAVGPDVVEEHPRERHDAEQRRDEPAHPERDVLRRQVREVERGRDHVRRHVRRDLGYRDDEHGEDEQPRDAAGELRDELDGVPDSLPEDDDRRRRDRDAYEAEGGHRQRETYGLPDDLRALALGVAGEVRDVQRERDPVADVRRQRGPEDRPERRLPLLQLRRGHEDVAHTAARDEAPDKQRYAAADQERR